VVTGAAQLPAQRRGETQPQQRAIGLICHLLILIGVLRMSLLVLHEPLLAFANQYDQVRTSACISLWPQASDGKLVFGQSNAAPYATFVSHDATNFACAPSSTVVFAALAHSVATSVSTDAAPTFNIRYLGALYVITVAIMAFCFDRAARRNVTLRLLNALTVVMIIADPFVTLFFNTLYTEPAAVIGFYGVAALTIGAATPLRPMTFVLFTMFASCLVFARAAHFALPLLCALVLFARASGSKRGLRYGIVAVASALMILQFSVANQDHETRMVNRTNALMQALAPEADAPAAWLASMRLPPDCARLLGISWYMTLDHDVKQRCPALRDLSTTSIAGALLAEPLILVRVFHKSILTVGSWRLAYLGEVERASLQRAFVIAPLLGYSITDLWSRSPFWLRLMLFGLPLCLGVSALFARAKTAGDWAQLSFGATLLMVWSVSLIGDGYAELARHMQLGAAVILASLILIIFRVLTKTSTIAYSFGLLICVVVSIVIHVLHPIAFALPNVAGDRAQLLVASSIPLTATSAFSITNRNDVSIAAINEPASDFAKAFFALPAAQLKLFFLDPSSVLSGSCKSTDFFVREQHHRMRALRVCAGETP
jgi:hypothetical protein